jgi:hypothetical protein
MRLWGCLAALPLLFAPLRAQTAAGPQRVIYDDDCSQDNDCVATLPILFQLASRGEIQILAMVADSANPLSAPVFRVFARQAGRAEMPIGANQGSDPATPLCAVGKCNESDWTEKLIERFDPRDTRARYPDCVTVYRKALAGQPEHSVSIVETGFATCLNQLLVSAPDAISPLTGAALLKRTVKMLSIMGGRYPAGTEWNFRSDAEGYGVLFATWTAQNGFPPVYLNGFANGEHVLAGPPASAQATVDPTAYGMQLCGVKQRPMWDVLSALYAAWGLTYKGTTYFTLSKPGTVTVDPKTGEDTWSEAMDSGHFVLTNAASDEAFSALLDGYAHDTGFLAKPAAGPRSPSTPGEAAPGVPPGGSSR